MHCCGTMVTVAQWMSKLYSNIRTTTYYQVIQCLDWIGNSQHMFQDMFKLHITAPTVSVRNTPLQTYQGFKRLAKLIATVGRLLKIFSTRQRYWDNKLSSCPTKGYYSADEWKIENSCVIESACLNPPVWIRLFESACLNPPVWILRLNPPVWIRLFESVWIIL